MKTQVRKPSPQVYARAAGLLYLLVITAGIISQIFINGKIITDDAAATSANMVNHSLLYPLVFYRPPHRNGFANRHDGKVE